MNNETFSTPILIIAWRRPKETKKVLNSLRKIKPSKLFISCDGAREGNAEEYDKVKKTQEVLRNKINWECEVNWQISDINLGCKIGVSNAINWFFNYVNEGIIIEDDIVANKDFFEFCEKLLEKYRKDKRIWCISGSNNQANIKRGEATYYFGRIPLIWGWATWKDRWKNYDININKWPQAKSTKMLDNVFSDRLQKQYWENIWDNFYSNGIPDTWDYAWVFTCIINNGLTIIPNKNLIKNIGFNSDATHTKWNKISTQKVESIEKKIVHPEFIICNLEAEEYQFDFFFGGYSKRLKKKPFLRIKNKFKRILNIKSKKK